MSLIDMKLVVLKQQKKKSCTCFEKIIVHYREVISVHAALNILPCEFDVSVTVHHIYK